MEPVFQVCIAGGGNLAHGSIGIIGHMNPKWKINLLSRRPEVWKDSITAINKGSIWEPRGDMVGRINKCSSKASEVVPGSHIIIICSPAHTKLQILQEINEFIEPGCLVGSIFGQGAFDWQAQHALGGIDAMLKRNITLFSLQYVPFLCKTYNYGTDVNIIGPKKHLYLTSFPLEKVHYASNALTQCYHIPTVPVPGFLNLTLCPSNQIIHPGRVLSFFRNWDGESTFEAAKMPKLYEDLDDDSAHEIEVLSEEIQHIKKAMLAKFPTLNLDQVLPIGERICSMYDGQVTDKSSLKRIFNTNLGYSRVPFPMVPKNPEKPNEVVLNKQARFFWEDVPFGLIILKDVGRIMGVPTPNMDKQIVFHQKFMPIKYIDEKTGEFIQESLKDTGAPSRYGINTPEDLVRMSLAQQDTTAASDIFFVKHKL